MPNISTNSTPQWQRQRQQPQPPKTKHAIQNTRLAFASSSPGQQSTNNSIGVIEVGRV
jgi:hypothetical protein